MTTPLPEATSSRPIELDGFSGRCRSDVRLLDEPEQLAKLGDPGQAGETIHWGRNLLYATVLETERGPLHVVVKQFRHERLGRRIRRRIGGSKARKSWDVALALTGIVRTPAPVLVLESREAAGPAWYVSERLAGAVEARYLFRSRAAGTFEQDHPGLAYDDLICGFGELARCLHDAGFWHRDLTIGNLLVAPGSPPEMWLVDLNRTRAGSPLSVSERMRDLCRMPIDDPAEQGALLEAYHRGSVSPTAAALYRFYRRAFALKNPTKARIRGGLRSLLAPFVARPATHLGDGDSDWDSLSDQPHRHGRGGSRVVDRLRFGGDHLSTAGAIVASTPGVIREWRRIPREPAVGSAPGRIGVGLGPSPDDVGAVLAAVEELGVRHALLRLHAWDEDHDRAEALAAGLVERGVEVAFALPWVRTLVVDPERWGLVVSELGRRFVPYGHHFQVGQAPNRSKWGIRSIPESVRLAALAAEALRAIDSPTGPIEVLGPAVIDFEHHLTAAALRLGRGVKWDVVSSLLYSDRRGEPEATQLGLDTLDKVRLLAAVARAAGQRRVWITEMNWPLLEGPYSPAGREVSVDEDAQAAYLVRYLLPVAASGLVERIYWWQLVARGYGLVDPRGNRRRPGFAALRDLLARLEGATVEEFSAGSAAGTWSIALRGGGRCHRAVWESGSTRPPSWDVEDLDGS